LPPQLALSETRRACAESERQRREGAGCVNESNSSLNWRLSLIIEPGPWASAPVKSATGASIQRRSRGAAEPVTRSIGASHEASHEEHRRQSRGQSRGASAPVTRPARGASAPVTRPVTSAIGFNRTYGSTCARRPAQGVVSHPRPGGARRRRRTRRHHGLPAAAGRARRAARSHGGGGGDDDGGRASYRRQPRSCTHGGGGGSTAAQKR
jgi:hypothetical protein